MKEDCREQNRIGNDLPDLLTSCPILAVSWNSLLRQGDSPGSQSSQTGIFGTAVEPILERWSVHSFEMVLHKNNAFASGVSEVLLLTKNVCCKLEEERKLATDKQCWKSLFHFKRMAPFHKRFVSVLWLLSYMSCFAVFPFCRDCIPLWLGIYLKRANKESL
jgi:hypothetical protein